MAENWIKFKCAECGEYFLESETYGGVCKDCYVPFAEDLGDTEEILRPMTKGEKEIAEKLDKYFLI